MTPANYLSCLVVSLTACRFLFVMFCGVFNNLLCLFVASCGVLNSLSCLICCVSLRRDLVLIFAYNINLSTSKETYKWKPLSENMSFCQSRWARTRMLISIMSRTKYHQHISHTSRSLPNLARFSLLML